MSDVYADEIKVGDSIEWAGRKSTITAIHPANSGQRKGVSFDVEVEGLGERRGLHYFASEQVCRITSSEPDAARLTDSRSEQ